VRYLAPFVLSVLFFSPLLRAGETSIEAALEKARQRAGAPASDSQAKKDKAREAALQKAREDTARKAREEQARKAKAEEEKKAAAGQSAPVQAAAVEPPAKPKIKVFTLKDGRQIFAVMVVELDDTYALKDKDGKLEEIKKEDVQSMQAAE
jgi:hypothetical protein